MTASSSREQRRRAIAAAAEESFYREGFGNVGIDRVAEAAEVALATLYRHYRGRSDLVVAAMRERERRYFAMLEQTAEGLEGEARVLSLFDGLGQWAEVNGGNGCLFLRAAAAHPDDEAIRAVAFAHKRACLELVRRRLLEGGWSPAQAEELAPTLFMLLEGAVAGAAILGDEKALAQTSAAARQLLRATLPLSD